jgi:outer membrane protein OmpA-like peptidoglycan-associated protein
MIKSGQSLIVWIAAPIILALATTGCATKSYVRSQVAPVNKSVATLKTDTNQKIAYINNKESSDISAVNERIDTTDQKVAQVASAAQEAQGTASRAMQETEGNSGKIAANSEAITTLGAGVANALNYQLVEKADITFGFNKATLTPEAKAALNQVAAKMQSLPRSVVELAGFTDRVGSQNYNLALSRRRAEAVQRYLVQQKVPLMAIHIVGLGKEAPPEQLEAEVTAVDPNATKAQLERLARRVHVRVFGAGDISASRSEQ